MASIVRGILFTGILFYTSLLYHAAALAHLGYASAALLILSCVFLVIRLFRMQCALTTPVTVAEQGQPFTVQLLVDSKGILPCAKVWCCMELSSSFSKHKKRRWLRAGAAFPGQNRYRFTMEFGGSGNYSIQLKKIRIYDFTGLFYIHKKAGDGCRIQVFPKMREIGVQLTERVKNFSEDADVFDEHKPGNDYSELFQTRPYQKGDKFRQVHWKLSAKMDELLVREGRKPKACPVIFLLDYCQGNQKRAEDANAFLVIMASIAFSIMDQGCPYYVVWYSETQGDMVRMRVDDEEGLYLFLCLYLTETFLEEPDDLLDAYKEKYRGEQFVTVLRLNEGLELFKNGERIEKFAGVDWEKTLEGLELIL